MFCRRFPVLRRGGTALVPGLRKSGLSGGHHSRPQERVIDDGYVMLIQWLDDG